MTPQWHYARQHERRYWFLNTVSQKNETKTHWKNGCDPKTRAEKNVK